MSKAYFNRHVPFFLERYSNFDGIEVEVDEQIVVFVEQIQKVLDDTYALIERSSAPEESNQEISNFFAGRVRQVIDGLK